MTAEVLLYTITSVVLVSLISFVSILLLAMRRRALEKMLLFLVSFAVGALLGDSFIHILPETIETGIPAITFGSTALMGIIIFFVIEKFLRWQHRHLFEHHEDFDHRHPYIKPFVWMNLIGDGLHNLIDGMVIAGSYLVSIPLGITTTLAVVIHECAQEIGDFAILIKGGLSRSQALFYNFLSALTAVAGGVITVLIGSSITNFSGFLLPFTFAGFTYIALATLIPEMHHEDTLPKLAAQVGGILLGVGVMALLIIIR